MKNLMMIMACFFFMACGDKEEEVDTAADAAEVNDTADAGEDTGDAGEQDGGATDE